YAFFDKIDNYTDVLDKAEKITSTKVINTHKDTISLEDDILDGVCYDNVEVSCNSLLNDDISLKYQSPHIICQQFKYLYRSLITMKEISPIIQVEENDYLFLSYWLSNKLRINALTSTFCVKDFYRTLQEMDFIFFSNELLGEKLKNIESYHLDNMNILLNLYKIKNEIYSIISAGELTNKMDSCLEYKKECNIKYREGIINCRDGCNDFHNALKLFKCIYENYLGGYKDNKDDSQYNELFKLPDHDSVVKEYRAGQFRKITTTSFLVPLFGLFFMLISSNKFSPYRHYLLEKIKSSKNEWFSVDERENELLSYPSDIDSKIIDESDYNIGYYSARNF
ncbi:PIR Superfamily Protein, partial [Plasmodium ovale curtisi]